jgi:hypothetical protein
MGGVVRNFIEGSPQVGVSTPAQTSVGAAAGLLIAANPKRKGLTIQNTGTTVIKLNFGLVDPTQTVYHLALAASTSADDGTGASYFETSWVGPVRAISSAGGGTLVMTEFVTGSPDWNQASVWGTQGLS